MELKYFETLKKHKEIILKIGVIVFGVFLFVRSFMIDTSQKRLDGALKNIQEENFQGFVIDKNFEKFNHNAAMIYLNNNTKFSVFGEFWPKIKIGDSVVKKKGETFITVYRNNQKFTLDNKDILDKLK